MKKQALALLLTSAMCVSLTSTSFATPTKEVQVLVNGDFMNMLVPPVIKQGHVLVPVRELSEALGYTVKWEQSSKTVYLDNEEERSDAQNPSNEKIIVNGNPIASDIPPQIIQGRTMVSVRTISEALGAKASWDQANRRVTVDTLKNTVSFPENVPLSFEPLDLQNIEQLSSIPSTWVKQDTITIGQIDQTEIEMDLYKVDSDIVPIINGIFSYKGQQFVVNDLNAWTINEVEFQQLNLEFGIEGNKYLIMSAIGVEYASKIILFDQINEEWLVLDTWGTLVASDSHGLYIQFPGRGTNPPDFSFIRLQNNRFVRASMNEIFQPFLESLDLGRERLASRFVTKDEQAECICQLKIQPHSHLISGHLA
ncbi:copper amine oxidase N-terminal domain-containing protein [Bacillus horti]|uniref:Copper amine oxidase-like N-terminal domain-containing protein n=1 Tax=Caldalkalibacillus horti TaxID=77523 RepID=A0ABT9VVB7_9BACI|nr:copper amine oxidase N-terminal domain-containing protein [Bacillus horti]MDQ0164928.1 hypothetical protein [Bacillus horti]